MMGSFASKCLFSSSRGDKNPIYTSYACDYFNDLGKIKAKCKVRFPYPKLVQSYGKLLEENKVYDLMPLRIDRRKTRWRNYYNEGGDALKQFSFVSAQKPYVTLSKEAIERGVKSDADRLIGILTKQL